MNQDNYNLNKKRQSTNTNTKQHREISDKDFKTVEKCFNEQLQLTLEQFGFNYVASFICVFFQ